MREGTTTDGNINQVANSYVVLGSGPTSTRPGAPENGTLRYNTTINAVEAYTNGAWIPFAVAIRPVFGSIAAQTGSTTLTNSNSAMTSSQGTQIMTRAYTPSSANSAIEISLNFMIDVSVSGAYISTGVFRGTTLIGFGVQSIDQFTNTLTTTQNIPAYFSMSIMDSPGSNAAVTYSARVAVSSGNWYVNRSQSFTYGNSAVNNGNYTIKEFL